MSATPVTTDIDIAVGVLRSGGIIGLPTETVYGLAARVSDSRAVSRVFAAKGRPAGHPLIVHVSSAAQAARYAHLDARAHALAAALWPGPLTILLPRTVEVPDVVTGGRQSVAVRVPAHPMALEVIDRLGEGVVAPSANRFGHVSPTSPSHVVADLDGLIDLVLDGGPCHVGVESTIVDCTGPLQVLRPGAISGEDIEAICGESIVPTIGESRAAGMLASHYAPRARVHLVTDGESSRTVAAALPDGATVRTIGEDLDAQSYAEALYRMLREADTDGITDVIAVLPTGDGLAAAVRDRLTKAAAERT